MLLRTASPVVLLVMLLLAPALPVRAQSTPFNRLPSHVFDAPSPDARVAGLPGNMSIQAGECRALAVTDARRRIIALAVQEWGYFGFPVVEYDADDDEQPPAGAGRVGGGGGRDGGPGVGRRRGSSRVGTTEAARTAASIGGYWAVAPGGAWILESQNEYWRDAISGVTRWRFPWSAAFISWLMCEGGLGSSDQFQRAIAHHTYIDQAIRARDGGAPRAAYVAHDVGEVAVAPGDLLCTSRRPVFQTLADRRRQMGQGARTHCDVVVKVDESASRILTIGGNVRGVVGLKLLPAVQLEGRWQPAGSTARAVFAHLQLRGPAPATDAFDTSPTLTALACTAGAVASSLPTPLRLVITQGARCGD